MINLKKALARTLRSGSTPPQRDANLRPTEPPRQDRPSNAPEAHAAPATPADPDATTDEPVAPAVDEVAPVEVPEEEAFSALGLRDRVVIMLLFDQIVTEEQVAEVWALWQQEYQGDHKTSLWRLLALIPEIDRELILAETARVYGIEEAHMAPRLVVPGVKKLAQRVSPALWDQIKALRLLPITETEQQGSHRKQTVFASHDPTHPEVKEVLQELGVGIYELRYAPEKAIVDIFAEAFPDEFRQLKRALDEERKRFAKTEKKRTVGVDPFEAQVLTEEPQAAPEAAPAVAPEVAARAAIDAVAGSPVPVSLADAPVPTTSSIITYFEELLIEAVRRGASGVCLVPNVKEKTEVYALMGEELSQWCLVDHIPPELLFSTIKSAIIRAEISFDEGQQHQIIDRWIDGKLVKFKISALPAGKMLDREAIVFRALKPLGK